jgi:tetratricopeptide (TPR) repeat protein
MGHALAIAAEAAGQDDLALTLYKALAASGGSADMFRDYGDLLAGKQRWAEAGEAYRKAAALAPDELISAFLAGEALVKADRADEGRRLMALARLGAPDDGQRRYTFAFDLRRRGLKAEADKQFEVLVRTAELDSYAAAGAGKQIIAARALKAGRFDEAADAFERDRLQCLGPVKYTRLASYLQVSADANLARARARAAAGDVDDAMAAARVALKALPGELDVPVELIGPLEKLGAKTQAGELFDAVYNHVAGIVKAYPRSARHRNQLAWLTARCRRRLDDGLVNAREAVRLKPESAGYLDTLAEVLFQRGDRDEAVKVIRRAVELSPKVDYYRKQLERFRTGDRSTDPPEP